MGGVFGKSKRPCVFPRVVYKARGKRRAGPPRVFCDAATWTGENHFQSARIGRTPKGPEPSAAKSVSGSCDSEFKRETAEPAAHHTETPLPVTAGEARGVEVPREPEATEVMQHQQLSERVKQTQSGPSSRSDDVLHPAGSCEDHEVTSPTQSTVKVEVHVSAGVQGGAGEVLAAPGEAELLVGAEQEAGAVCVAQEACVGKAHWEVPVQKAGDSPAASCAGEEAEVAVEAAETGEGSANGQRPAEEQGVEETECCAAKAPPDPQLGQDEEVAVTEGMKEGASEAEQAEETAGVCDDGQAAKEIPWCLAETQAALQEKEEITDSSEGKPEEQLKEQVESGAATTDGLSAAQ